MKNPEINIIKKLSDEQKKLLFFAPIGIIILFICGYVLFSDKKENKDDVINNPNNWVLPNDSQKDLPSSSLDIQDELNKHNKKNTNDDFFDDLNNVHSKENVSDDLNSDLNKKDSMYLKIKNQLKNLENKKQPRTYSNRQAKTVENSQVNEEESQISEYKRLAEMKEFMLKNSQDYSRKETPTTEVKAENNIIDARAAIYKNQFILPGDRVKLILTHSLVVNGNLFEKNTPFYAMVNINKSRVLLTIENINGVPVNLIVKDINDQMTGLYNKRAGELWSEYEKDQSNGVINGVSNEINTGNNLINNSIRAIGGFFKRKKIKETDKILLINDHEVILTNKK